MENMRKPIAVTLTKKQLLAIVPGVHLREIHPADRFAYAWAGKPREVVEIINRTPEKVWFTYKCGDMPLRGSACLGKRRTAIDFDFPIASRWIFEGDPVPKGVATQPFTLRCRA